MRVICLAKGPAAQSPVIAASSPPDNNTEAFFFLFSFSQTWNGSRGVGLESLSCSLQLLPISRAFRMHRLFPLALYRASGLTAIVPCCPFLAKIARGEERPRLLPRTSACYYSAVPATRLAPSYLALTVRSALEHSSPALGMAVRVQHGGCIRVPAEGGKQEIKGATDLRFHLPFSPPHNPSVLPPLPPSFETRNNGRQQGRLQGCL